LEVDLADPLFFQHMVANPRHVRAWEVLYGDGNILYKAYRSDPNNFAKIDDYLNHNPSKADELSSEFISVSNKDNFINSFIGGPLRKNELEEVNFLYYKEAITYETGPNAVYQEQLTPIELTRRTSLDTQMGSFEHPSQVPTNSNQIIVAKSTELQGGPDHFWADIKVVDGKITGLKPDIKYDYVITNNLDGSPSELRLGLGHFRISGNSLSVKGAGSLKMNSDGKIYYINRQSGHFYQQL
jgi:hypothetical protein